MKSSGNQVYHPGTDCSLTLYLPTSFVCASIFLFVAYDTVVTIKNYSCVRKNVILLLLYTSMNLDLLSCTMIFISMTFPELGGITKILFVVESFAINTFIFAFIARTISSFRFFGLKKFTILFLQTTCWVLLCGLLIFRIYTKSRDNIGCFIDFPVFGFVSSSALAVTFGYFTAKAHAKFGGWIFFKERLFTIYYVSQIVGEMLYGVVCIISCWCNPIWDNNTYTAGAFKLALLLLNEIIPCSTLIIILSNIAAKSERNNNSQANYSGQINIIDFSPVAQPSAISSPIINS